jgi:hypothetical protein
MLEFEFDGIRVCASLSERRWIFDDRDPGGCVCLVTGGVVVRLTAVLLGTLERVLVSSRHFGRKRDVCLV